MPTSLSLPAHSGQPQCLDDQCWVGEGGHNWYVVLIPFLTDAKVLEPSQNVLETAAKWCQCHTLLHSLLLATISGYTNWVVISCNYGPSTCIARCTAHFFSPFLWERAKTYYAIDHALLIGTYLHSISSFSSPPPALLLSLCRTKPPTPPNLGDPT